METPSVEIAAVLFGILIRLGIPFGLTILLSLFLKWLDERWQAQAEAEAQVARAGKITAYRRPCWEIHRCPPRLRQTCRAYNQPDTPCWELFRINGRLKPACQNCKVLPPATPLVVSG